MSTRKIIDIEQNGEKVWPKGHAKATFMSNGSTVEDAINSIQTGSGGGMVSETDPIFSASPAASITEEKKTEWDNKMDKVTLAEVATSGSYNDLSNKPTIPAAVTESTVSGWGFTKNTGTYSKPSGGIPKGDLASAVQTSLGKADTALQSYTEQYKGTITGVTIEASNGLSGGGTVSADTGSTDGTIKIRGVAATNKGKLGMSVLYSGDLKDKTYQDGAAAAAAHTHSQYLTGVTINGTTKNPSSGVVDLGTVITAHQTLKTINGESIVGSGNITISGGGSGSSSGSGAYPEVDGSIYKQEDYSDNYYSTDLTPNTFYVFPECGTLDVFLGPQMAGIANEYIFQFTSGSEPTSLILPSDIKWSNGEAPVIEANKIYQISILNGLGTVMSWDNSNLISFSIMWGASSVLNFECEKDMTWEAFVASSYNTDSMLKISNGNIWYSSYRIEDATPTSIIENGKMYTSIYDD